MTTALAIVLLAQNRPSPDWGPLLEAPANLTHELTIPAPQTAGPRLRITGRVLKADRKTPVAGVVLYFHHTDGTGVYPRPSGAEPREWRYWHGSLRGWLKTDAQGRYVLKTTRPAPYPGRRDPAHIHAYGMLPGAGTGIYFSDIVFADDPLLTAAYWDMIRRQGLEVYSGVTLRREGDGVLVGEKDMILPTNAR